MLLVWLTDELLFSPGVPAAALLLPSPACSVLGADSAPFTCSPLPSCVTPDPFITSQQRQLFRVIDWPFCSGFMYGNCKAAEDVWQAVEVLFLSIKIAKYMFNEVIWIITLAYHNASCSFIHCMELKKKSIINGKNNIYFYPKYMSRNAGIVTSEYQSMSLI